MVDMELADIAVDGLVSIAEAAVIGVDPNSLRRRVRAGEIHRLIPGWYAVRSPDGDADRHALRTRAVLRHLGDRVQASHHSAVLLHGLPTWRADLATVHVCRRTDRQSRRGNGLSVHPSVGNFPGAVLPPAIAVLQAGMLAGPESALVSADAALHRRRVTADDLAGAAEVLRRQPGMAAVRAVLPFADGRHESPGETRLAFLLRGLRVKATPQVWVRDGQSSWRVDFLLDDAPVVIEFDGLVKYQDGSRGAEVLVAEKLREDSLRGLGYEVVRLVWADLADPARLLRRIEQAIARARRAA